METQTVLGDGLKTAPHTSPESPATQLEEIHPIPVETPVSHEQSYTGLLPLLTRLDQRLTAAVEATEQLFAARAAGDLYRGLAITPADVAAAFSRVPGEPFLALSQDAIEIAEATNSLSVRRLLWLQHVYQLTEFDVDVLILGLAPEIDLRYERLYAYLQDDVTRRRPGIDLALNLLCGSAGEKLEQRGRFGPDAPLLAHRLIEIVADPHHPHQPLLARFFRLDEQIVRFLLLDDSMDSRLKEMGVRSNPAQSQNNGFLTDEMRHRLGALAANHPPLLMRLLFVGPADCGQSEAVTMLASTLGLCVLEAELECSGNASAPSDDKWHALVREAWLRGALLHVRGLEVQPFQAETKMLETLRHAIQALPIPLVIESRSSSLSAGNSFWVDTVRFALPESAQREDCWRQCLSKEGVAGSNGFITMLAQRYRLTFAQIRDAARMGTMPKRTATSSAEETVLLRKSLTESAKAQTQHALGKLALHMQSERSWQDLIVSEDAKTQLEEICAQVTHRWQVLEDWGYGKKLSYGKGVNVLFSGPSGTGKTMAAEIIANELNLDLYKIDLAAVVSKYIGETEKNLDKIFTAAEQANAILFFDEADALFGKRSEVKDSHDRYANLEISYLLQKMEQHEGIAILATNLRQNLDDAFVRRLTFIVHFPFPDETMRRRIWAGIWPSTVPLAEDVNPDALAKQLKLSGGSIRNVALSATFLGAGDGQSVTLEHVQRAAQREFQKLGKSPAPTWEGSL